LRYLIVIKATIWTNTREYLEGLALLFEIYADLNHLNEVARIVDELNCLSRKLGTFLHDPLAEALFRSVRSHEGRTNPDNRQHAFAFALMTLCRCITRGHHTAPSVPALLEGLQAFFKSFGIGEGEWEWVVKHARLNKYDFVGLLSVLLQNMGQVSIPLEPMLRKRVRVIDVR
jgi:hypothetical protein